MKRIKNIILINVIAICTAFSQSANTELWQKNYDAALKETPVLLEKSGDFEYIMAGSLDNTLLKRSDDIFIKKVNITGDEIWKKELGTENEDIPYYIGKNIDGSYLLIYSSYDFSSQAADINITKFDANGKQKWERKYFGHDHKSKIRCYHEEDGSFLITGVKISKADRDKEIWILKLDKFGKMQWQYVLNKRYSDEEIYEITKSTINEGYYLAGYTRKLSDDDYDGYIVKITERGIKEWDKTYGENGKDIITQIKPLGYEEFLCAGTSNSFGAKNEKIWVMKISLTGESSWKKLLGNFEGEMNNIRCFMEDDKFFISSTVSDPMAKSNTGYIIALTSKGNLLWETSVLNEDLGTIANIIQNKDNNFILSSTLIDEETGDYALQSFSVNPDLAQRNAINNDKPKEPFPGSIPQAPDAKSFGGGGYNMMIGGGSGEGRYVALIIAVNEYEDPRLPDLDQPVTDAEGLIDVLKNNYMFDENNIIFLQNPKRADLITALDNLERQVTNKDNLLIFYAGHGYWDEKTEKGYWLPSDAQQDNTANWFRNTSLSSYIGSIKSNHTLLIADACFSGGIFKTRSAMSSSTRAIERLSELNSRKAMTSGTLKEVPDQSVFMKYLIKRLKENDEKYLPSEQLFFSFKTAVLNNSQNIPQFGVIKDSGDEGGDFIFVKQKK